jgi:glycosyltransferase involved in cell wall biosynthesis
MTVIGIDASTWSNRRGFGRFTRSLLREMLERRNGSPMILVTDDDNELTSYASPPDIVVHRVQTGRPVARAAGAASSRSVRDLLRMSLSVSRLRTGAFLFPTSYSYYPVFGTPVVVTVHDAIAERLPHLTLGSRADRVRWRLKQTAACRQAAAVLTVSEASRAAILEHLSIRPDRVHVIREAPDPRFQVVPQSTWMPRVAAYGLDATEYFLYVGGISPHKNLETLVAAFDIVAARRAGVHLVIVGDATDDPFLSATQAVQAAIDRSPARARIHLTGYAADDDLVSLYNGAVALAHPSLAEGYGLTVAEAAACGTPVIVSNDPALRELLGDAGLYAEPRDARGFAEHCERLLSDPGERARRADAVRREAATWSWRDAADRTLELLDRVARRG